MDREDLRIAKEEFRNQYGCDPKVIALSVAAARNAFRPWADECDLPVPKALPETIDGMAYFVSTRIASDPGFFFLPPGLNT